MKAARLVKNVKVATPRAVAKLGFKAMMKGKPVAIHGAMNKVAPFAIRFLPRKWVTRLSAKVMGRSKEFL
jgi:short-subunit dehydrogenase